ncbi:DHA1 family bicyclomycin/chloramphenicol resistance-like MFS transporter [Tamaricihabitans halophyticus]|uniref:DHA1 family bicyclomycin/chloramphenicol resistance-like MFS transporter n=1 Tax=Tamaricihabitans halophyticus TaxID=1262583 RepID=A0A4R2QCT7_9PSEU|nr:Bcr/CflA family multidrug efflux MFS transporter [Tamaricihabitans halophyticus]TCP46843.1 DHA1 family bicyclomycin/chloramphenicol resistance-like MFS transporter [Tamaricihabitans halophyticus]
MTTTITSTQPTTNGVSRRRKLRFALILGGLTALGPLSIDMYLPALPTIAGDLSTSASSVQLTLTACVIGIALGQIIAGPLSDSLGRRKPLLVGLAIYTALSIGCAVAPTVETLMLFRALQAIGAAAGIVIARAAVRDLFSGKAMTRFFSNLMLVTGLAPILAPVIGGQVLQFTTWRGVFVILAAFGAILFAVVAFGLPETLPTARRAPARIGGTLRVFGGLLTDRMFIGYGLACGLMFASIFAYISGSSFVLQDLYGLSPQAYSLVFGLNSIGLVAFGQINGRIVGRFSERGLLRTGLILASIGGIGLVIAAVSGAGLAGLLPPLFLLISGNGFVMPNATALVLGANPKTAGSASALLGVLQFVVGGLAAPLVGLGGQSSALPMALVMAGLAIAALIAFTLIARPAPRRPNAPAANAVRENVAHPVTPATETAPVNARR